MPDDERTQEQLAAEKAMQDAGYEPGILNDTGEVVPIGTAPPAPDALPPPVIEAPKPEMVDAERYQRESQGWKERAEREEKRADRERTERESLAAENTRLRAAVGLPTPSPTKPARELTEEQKAGVQWLRENLPDVLSEVLPQVSAEVLGKHPAFRGRDVAILKVNERLEQTSFLSGFSPEQRRVVKDRVLSTLMAERQAGGFQKGYDELWDNHVKSLRESAELYGMKLAEEKPATPPPPEVKPAVPLIVPPSLAGVRGSGGPPSGERPQPLTMEEMKLYGWA